MKRLTFQCAISCVDDFGTDPERFVQSALTYGDKHQDYVIYSTSDIKVEEFEEND